MRLLKKNPDKVAEAAIHGHSLITLRNVVKYYQTPAGSYPALQGVNLDIDASQFVAIVGKSGSGKSTLLNMITGIDRPSEGEIYIRGTAIHTLPEKRMAKWRGREQGIIFQFFQLIPTLTIMQNIILPMEFAGLYTRAERRTRALMLLDQVGLEAHVDKLPSALSGGQQQRAAIARALANDPPIVVADEPTGNLDSATASVMLDLFDELVAGGKTIVMVTHDEDLAQRANRIIHVVDGQVYESKRESELFILPEPYKAYETSVLEEAAR